MVFYKRIAMMVLYLYYDETLSQDFTIWFRVRRCWVVSLLCLRCYVEDIALTIRIIDSDILLLNFILDRVKQTLKQPYVFDLRNIYKRQEMEAKGFLYFGVGQGRTIGTDIKDVERMVAVTNELDEK